MVERSRIRILTGALAAAILPSLSGCVGPPYEGPPPAYYPPWYYDYYYYPHVDVYFHIYSGYYWYRDGRSWRRVRRLPPHIRLHPRQRVPLRIPDERPYLHHDEHRRRYPPPQARPQPPQPRPRAPQPGAPPPQPRLEREQREWRERDREERENNLRRYEEYRKRRWVRPK